MAKISARGAKEVGRFYARLAGGSVVYAATSDGRVLRGSPFGGFKLVARKQTAGEAVNLARELANRVQQGGED